MKIKTFIFDIIFIIVLAIFLVILSETNNIAFLTKMPFITLFVVYSIGKLSGSLSKCLKK